MFQHFLSFSEIKEVNMQNKKIPNGQWIFDLPLESQATGKKKKNYV